MMDIRYGGNLKSGDFVAVSRGNYIELGWYVFVPNKKSLFYYSFDHIKRILYKPDLELKNIYRSYVADQSSRTVLITDPLQVMALPQDQETFIKGTELLKKFKLIQ